MARMEYPFLAGVEQRDLASVMQLALQFVGAEPLHVCGHPLLPHFADQLLQVESWKGNRDRHTEEPASLAQHSPKYSSVRSRRLARQPGRTPSSRAFLCILRFAGVSSNCMLPLLAHANTSMGSVSITRGTLRGRLESTCPL